MKHDDISVGHIHLAYNWTYADATARLAATGFALGDVGKLARQLDDDTLWMLTDDSPIAWAQVGGASPTSLPPSGTAGGDLAGTYPNPTVQNDSHAHTADTLPATMPPSAHSHTAETLPATMPPSVHASAHKSAGGDAIKLDELAAPTDVTTLNVSTTAHGLTPKLPNDATKYLDGEGAWTAPEGSGGGGAALTVKEEDGTPSVANVTEIKVTNGTLTDNGDGSVSLDLSSSGGGGSGDTFSYYDPDKPPTLPNAKDDEFDGAALDAKWTVINPSYLTTYDVNATVPDHLYAKHVADNSPDQLSGFFQSAPAGDFTFIAKMGALFGQQNYMRACGIFVGEGTPGQMQCIGFGFEGGPQLRVGHYGAGGNIDAWHYSMATDRHDGYLRFTQVGSTWAWSFSGDGLSWMTFYSGSSQFTIASIGLVFGSYGSLTVKPEITCDWFRVFSGTALVTGGLRSVGVGSGHAIQDEEVPLTTRSSLNFVGAGVTVTDDEANDATIVTIPSGGSAASANIAEHQQMMDTFTGNGATTEFQLTDFGLPGSTRVFVGGTPQRLNVDYWEMPRGYSIKFAAAPANTAVIWVDYRRANGDDLLTLQNPFLIGDATGWTLENGSWSSNTHLLGGCIQGNGASGQYVGYQTASLRKGLYVVSFSAYSAWGDSPSLHIYDNTRAIQYGSIAAYPGGGAWGRATARMVLPKTGQYCFRFYQPNNSDRFADLVVARVGDLAPALDFQNAAAIVPNGNFLDDTTGWTLTGANAREAGIPGGILGGCVFNNVNTISKAEANISLETADYAICFNYFNQWGGSANAQIVDAGDSVVWTSGELNGFTNNQWHSLVFVFQGATAGAYRLQMNANSNNHIYYGGIRMSKVSS